MRRRRGDNSEEEEEEDNSEEGGSVCMFKTSRHPDVQTSRCPNRLTPA